MDINRLRKLSGISEDPMQVPPKKRLPMPKPPMPTPEPEPPMPTPTPDTPQPMPDPIPGPKPGKPSIPTAPSRRDEIDSELIHMPPPDWDGWDEFNKLKPNFPASPKKDDDTVITSPSLRDYLKMVRR